MSGIFSYISISLNANKHLNVNDRLLILEKAASGRDALSKNKSYPSTPVNSERQPLHRHLSSRATARLEDSAGDKLA